MCVWVGGETGRRRDGDEERGRERRGDGKWGDVLRIGTGTGTGTGLRMEMKREAVEGLPSIKHSLTISHSRFMSLSGRYLHCFACSSHSSGPAPGDKRAGPGCGTSPSVLAMVGYDENEMSGCGWRWRWRWTDDNDHVNSGVASPVVGEVDVVSCRVVSYPYHWRRWAEQAQPGKSRKSV